MMSVSSYIKLNVLAIKEQIKKNPQSSYCAWQTNAESSLHFMCFAKLTQQDI